MPLISDDGTGREARVDPRDGCLKDTRDFAKDPRDFARERAERQERSSDRRVEPGERDRVELREHKDPEKTFNVCAHQPALEVGVDRAAVGTAMLCFAAGVQGLANPVTNAGCAAGGVVTGLGYAANNALLRHCNN